jgi:hemolysin D
MNTSNPSLKPPFLHKPRRIMGLLGLVLLIVIAYACWAPVDVVISTPGKVVFAGKSKVVQPLEAGVVRSIAVRDGQSVKTGQVLIELDSTATQADHLRLQRSHAQACLRVARLQAQLAGRFHFKLASLASMPSDWLRNETALLKARLAERQAKWAGLDAQLAREKTEVLSLAAQLQQVQRSLPLIREKQAMREELAKSGYVSQKEVIDGQLENINADKDRHVLVYRLEQARSSYKAVQAQYEQALAEWRGQVGTELAQAMAQRDEAAQELVKARQRQALQTLRAPIDGVVQQLAVTTVGGVVTAAQPLLTLVPHQATLEVEAGVLNKDVGQIRVGQTVIHKLEAYDFTRYGVIQGQVLWVGHDAIQDPKLGPIYPVRMSLSQTHTPYAAHGRRGVVEAGMNITTDVQTDQRHLIDYFIAPLVRYKEEALRER